MDVWEREKGEPNLWYERFEVFRLLGVGRSLDGAYRASTGSVEGGAKGRKGARATGHWRRAAQRWRWVERAEAWDTQERELLQAAEADRRFDARQRRLARIETLQTKVYDQLAVSDPLEMKQEAMVVRLLALMKAERLEFGEASQVTQNADGLGVQDQVDGALKKVYG